MSGSPVSWNVRIARLTLAFVAALISFVLATNAVAQAPSGYYNGVDTSSPQALRTTLHDVIDDHTRFPYTSSATDTWNILEQADEDPANASRILDIYLNESYPKQGQGNSFYDREHVWPNSYGFPVNGSTNYPFSDCHMLFLCDGKYNSSRSNKPFRNCDASCTEKETEVNQGMGGGSGTYPGNSNWTTGSFAQGTWEAWIGRRGDVARAIFYADVRYEGGMHGVANVPEPDLILTDSEALIASGNTGNNESVAYMGMLTVLLQWHAQDPVDSLELSRNDVIYSYQGNRNPFVDHPEWVDCIFNGNCGSGGDTTPPQAPTGLVASPISSSVGLDWDDNTEFDLAGYNLYRSSGGSPFAMINTAVLQSSNYDDNTVTNGVTYSYYVTAEDFTGNESGASSTVNATPTTGGSGGATPWINEVHYDNSGQDTGEFVEIAGSAGASLSGWQVVGYNGSGGSSYKTISLSGTIPDQQAGVGTLAFTFTSMQNGAPDGLALVEPSGNVKEFISYEGSFAAVGGPADGMTSTDMGVSESSGTPAGFSLQKAGTGSVSGDFTWQAEGAHTSGLPNTGQTFSAGSDTTPPVSPTGLIASAVLGGVDLDWNDNVEADLAGYDVYRGFATGGPYTALTTSLLTSSQFTDSTVSEGVAYYYVVTAWDTSGNESSDSNEAHETTPLCQADLGFANHPTATLAACGGDLSTGSDGQLTLSGLPTLPSSVPILFAGLQSNPTSIFELGGGTLVPLPAVVVLTLPNSGTGTLTLPIPGGSGPFSAYVQYVISEPAGATVSNALRLDFLP